jgi:hypothetical protein
MMDSEPQNQCRCHAAVLMLMEEARYRALFLTMFMLTLMIGGKCPCLKAKLAHLAGHLPEPLCILGDRLTFGLTSMLTSPPINGLGNHRLPRRMTTPTEYRKEFTPPISATLACRKSSWPRRMAKLSCTLTSSPPPST